MSPEIDVKIFIMPSITRLWFEKRELKSALLKGGRVVQKEARRLVAHRAISKPDQFPGYDSGTLSKSIKATVGSGGGYVKVMPNKTAAMKEYYPAFLYYGTCRGLKPRKNYMTEALVTHRDAIKRAIRRALVGAIKVNQR